MNMDYENQFKQNEWKKYKYIGIAETPLEWVETPQ